MTWKAEIVNDKIHLHTGAWPGDAITTALRNLPGGQWNDELKRRILPLRWETCKQIRVLATRFDVDLQIGPDLEDWAWAERERRKEIPSVNDLQGARLHHLPATNPKLAGAAEARPFQKTGMVFGAINRELLIADDPGLGKTMQVIGMFQEAQVSGPILVVAPTVAASITWPAEMARWGNGDLYGCIGAHLTVQERAENVLFVNNWCSNNPGKRFWIFTSPYYIRCKAAVDERGNYVRDECGNKTFQMTATAVRELLEVTWSGIVVDESHIVLAASTGNKKKFNAQQTGMHMLKLVKDGYRVAMSGTPFRGKKANAFGTLQWLRPDLYTSYWKWVDRHFVTFQDEFGYSTSPIVTDELKSTKAFYGDLARVMVRRTKAEVVAELPPKMYAGTPLDPNDEDSPIRIWLPMEGMQKRLYDKMLQQSGVELKGGQLLANGVLPLMARLKQFASSEHKLEYTANADGFKTAVVSPTNLARSNKFKWVQEWLEERDHFPASLTHLPPPGGKVIIASQFTKLLNEYYACFVDLGVPCHILTGETSNHKRQKMMAAFQGEGGPRVFLLNTIAGGVSITLDAADDVIMLDETPIPDDQTQVEDRAHRISRTDHQVTIWKLASLDSIEEAIAVRSNTRDNENRAILDGARGVEYARMLLEYGK